ncbi:MAG: M1 family metallopeptidase [Gemmatimonadales bacterium]
MLTIALLALVQQAGVPAGPRSPYWQQHLSYHITAALDEPSGTLSGTQRVVYRNNSPDTLRTVAFHLYLNAFRPGSRWADADSAERRRRFNDLRDPDFAFNRIANARIMGRVVEPVWPYAPDSSIVRFALPGPLPPGGSMEMSLDWWGRPSTLPRRQGRRGRSYDFAQWYPRVVAYDRLGWQEHPLYPAGEFYGDFGDFTVELDVPEDQVVGATGVPVCGDPGWGRTPGRPGGQPARERRDTAPGGQIRRLDLLPRVGDSLWYRRDFYGPAPAACAPGSPAAGRKRIVWRAENVHHFAMSMSPDYRYEGGRYGDIGVHVLYRPGDERTWGGGIAVERTVTALAWLDSLFGPYPWPQITNVHRIEGGGTEFPMMVHDGSASLGLILHEVGHNYLMGILANNEWREGFLDEGFTSFQTSLYFETHPTGIVTTSSARQMLLSDLDGWSEPTSLVSERYRDFNTYNRMIYDRGELFYHQLRRIVGDSTMRRILRTYYDRWKLRHVDEAAFREVAEEVSKRDLATFFGQWLHGVTLYDYAVGSIKADRADGRTAGRPDGQGGDSWVTRVEVRREAAGMMPVRVLVRSDRDSAIAETDGLAERAWVTVVTDGKPVEVRLHSGEDAHDWNALNDRRRKGLLGWNRRPRHELYFDTQLSKRVRRDRMTLGVAPTLWYNDAGGLTGGVRLRSDYLGRFEQNVLQLTVEPRDPATGGEAFPQGFGAELRLRNPVAGYMPRTTQTLEGYWTEGRAGAAAQMERNRTRHQPFGPQTMTGGSLRWLTTSDTDYLDPARWDGGGFVEGKGWIRSSDRRGPWELRGLLEVGGGVEYRNRGGGLSTDDRYDVQPYARFTAEVVARRSIGQAAVAGVRLFGGWVESGSRTLQQRRLFLAGGDPVKEFANPFLRSRGALLAGNDVHYHLPGGGGVRGLSTGLTASRLGAINLEFERRVYRRTTARLFREIRMAAFADGALADGDIRLGDGEAFAGDLGLGVRAAHRIGETSFVTRIDFPLLVSRSELAVHSREDRLRFRYVVSFEPTF